MNELENLHRKHGLRPDVFGDSEGEHEIEILTGEITQVKFHKNLLTIHLLVSMQVRTVVYSCVNSDFSNFVHVLIILLMLLYRCSTELNVDYKL